MNTEPADHTRTEPSTTSRRDPDFKKIGLVALAVLVAFGIGFLWQWVAANQLRGELETIRMELALERLEAELAGSVVDAQFGRFESGRRRASTFFSELQGLSDGLPDSLATLRVILDERDEVITALSRANPQSAALLARLLERYRGERGDRPSEVAPSPETEEGEERPDAEPPR